ncbi:hypothetical protein ACVMB3_007325 [Sinorhizobium meliloti]
MPVLKNTRHEKFAHASAKGNTVEEAYVAGGFKANRGNAAHLNANESVQDRVAENQGVAWHVNVRMQLFQPDVAFKD